MLNKIWRGSIWHTPKYYYLFFVLIIIFRICYSALFVGFGQDVARDSYIARQNIEAGRYIPVYGPKASVWNFYLPPFYYQLHILASLMTNLNPLAMKWLITIVESFTPIILFLLLRQITKPTTALFASALYTFSPAVLFYATNAWNPNMIPFLSILFIFSLIIHFQKGSKPAIIVAVISLTLALHLHYQSIVLIPFLLVAAIKSILTTRSNLKFWLIGIALSLITLSPYFYAEITSNFQNTKSIAQYFSLEHSNYYDRISKPEYIMSFIPGYFERTLRGLHTDYWFGRAVLILGSSFLLIRVAKKDKTAVWILLYFVLILIMLRIYKGDKVDYYLDTIMFMPFVFIALIVDKIKLASIIMIGLILSVSIPIFLNQKAYNELESLKSKIKVLEEFVKVDTVSLLFHNDDLLNLYAYGFVYLSDLKINQNSHNLLEVCRDNTPCAYDGFYWCKPNKTYMYVAGLKEKKPYDQISFRIDGQQFVMTYFHDNGTESLLPLDKVSGYGSDFIFHSATIE